ncbi:MAG: cadherin-like domain-containing protein [Planctomycetes bacterium]|nr:cadherin-like domain-containing protein [Planctomycetota bacterium]
MNLARGHRLVPTMLALAAAACADAAVSGSGVEGGPYTIDPASIDGGGGRATSPGNVYVISASSIGQISATAVNGGGVYTARTGYVAQLRSVGLGGGGSNQPPTINVIANRTVLEDAGTQTVNLGGISDGGDSPSQSLTITATSSDLSVILNPTVVYTAGASTGQLLFAPLPNASGTATITVSIADSGSPSGTVSTSFQVTVLPVNDGPGIDTPVDLAVNEDSGQRTISLTGISAGAANETQILSVTALSSNTSIIPNPTITYTSPNTTGLLRFTPVANANGTVTILLRVQDDGGTANGGVNVSYRSFEVRVDPVADSPILVTNLGISLPETSSAQITNLRLRVDDDGGPSQVTYTLSTAPARGEIRRLGTALVSGQTFTQSDLDGGLAVYADTGSGAGSTTFQFTAQDGEANGFTDGVGTPLAAQTFTITLSAGAPVNNAPTIALPSPMDTWTEGDPPLLVDSAALVDDTPDNLAGGRLTAQLINGTATANDNLAVRNTGTGAGQIGVAGSTVTYQGVTIGVIDATQNGIGGAALRIDLAGAATEQAVQALARALTFHNTSTTPSTVTRRFQAVLSDGAATPGVSAVEKDIAVIAVNSLPVVAWSKAATAFTENDPAILLDDLATLSDSDSTDLDGGTITVSFTSGGGPADTLTVLDDGPGVNTVDVSGANILWNGTTVGIVSGGASGTPLTIALQGALATPEVAREILRNIQYSNASDNPVTTQRVIEAVVNDGDGGTSLASVLSLSFTAVNDDPTMTLPGPALAWSEALADPIALIDVNALIGDVDSADFNNGLMVVEFVSGALSEDQIRIKDEGVGAGQINVLAGNVRVGATVIGTVSGSASSIGPMLVQFNSNATPAIIQQLARRLAYTNTSSSPTELPSRVMRTTLFDGDGGTSTPAIKTITVDNVNAKPIVTLPGGGIGYTENAPAALLDVTATVTDADSSDFAGGSLTVAYALNGHADDRLSIRNIGVGAGQIGIAGSAVSYGGNALGTFSGGTGTTPLTVAFTTSYATPTAIRDLMRAIEFANVSDDPTVAVRSVQFVVNDGDGDASDPVTTTVTVTPVNDAPVASAFTLGTIEGISVMVDLAGEARGSDAESAAAALSFAIVAQPAAGTGTVAPHATRPDTLVFTPDPGYVGTTTFTYEVSDGSLTSTTAGTVTVRITARLGENRPHPVSDPPRLIYAGNSLGYDLVVDDSQLGGSPNMIFRLAGNAPAGVTVTKNGALDATVGWPLPAGTTNAHGEFGVVFTDVVSGASGFVPLQYLLLPDPMGGG